MSTYISKDLSTKTGLGLPKLLFLVLLLLALTACSDMRDQPKYEPLEDSLFFADQRSARPIPGGTVPREEAVENSYLYNGRSESGELIESYPFPITREVLEQGQDGYDVFCAPCHGLDGYGEGMIIQRGFAQPPSLHINRLRTAPAGYFFDVITNGYGQMYSYAHRVPPEERWAITAYIRALQLSQNASTGQAPANEIQNLESQP